MRPAQYAKAIIGAVVAALTTLAGFLIPGTTAAIIVAVALAFFVTLGAVFIVPNAPSTPADQKGHGDIYLTGAVVVLVLVVLVFLRVFGVI